jgi:fermentation-respiration switch protein FrsA (DUF1100 family)
MAARRHAGKNAAPPRWPRRRVVRWCVRLAVLALLIGYPLGVGCDSWFYLPDDEVYYQPEQFGLQAENVRLVSRDGVTLAGWFLPAVGPARGTVVHFHGNAANITNHIVLVEWLPAQGYHVLMFDYRGYGRSEGKPTRAGTIVDGHAAVDYVLTRPECRGRPVFAYGQSLGAAVAIVVAADRPEVRAVIAESPFSGYRRMAARVLQERIFFGPLARGLAALTISAGHEPIDAVGRLAPRPLLVVLAEADQICAPELGRELFDAASAPKALWVAAGAPHLGILDDHQDELVRRITDFLGRAAAGP